METVIKESASYRLRVRKNPCLRPEDLNNLEFVQEMLDEKGKISQTSTYQFFMTDAEIKLLCEKLVK